MLDKIKMLKSKKGYTIQDLVPLAIGFVVVAIVIGLGATILNNIQGTQVSNSAAFNATGYGLTSLNTMSSYLPTLAIVTIAAVIVGIIIVYFRYR